MFPHLSFPHPGMRDPKPDFPPSPQEEAYVRRLSRAPPSEVPSVLHDALHDVCLFRTAAGGVHTDLASAVGGAVAAVLRATANPAEVRTALRAAVVGATPYGHPRHFGGPPLPLTAYVDGEAEVAYLATLLRIAHRQSAPRDGSAEMAFTLSLGWGASPTLADVVQCVLEGTPPQYDLVVPPSSYGSRLQRALWRDAQNAEEILWWCRVRIVAYQLLSPHASEELLRSPAGTFFRSLSSLDRVYRLMLCGSPLLAGAAADVAFLWGNRRDSRGPLTAPRMRSANTPWHMLIRAVTTEDAYDRTNGCFATYWQYSLVVDQLISFFPRAQGRVRESLIAQQVEMLRVAPLRAPLVVLSNIMSHDRPHRSYLAMEEGSGSLGVALDGGFATAVVALLSQTMTSPMIHEGALVTYRALDALRDLVQISTHHSANPVAFLLTPVGTTQPPFVLCDALHGILRGAAECPLLSAAVVQLLAACVHHNVRDMVPALMERGMVDTVVARALAERTDDRAMDLALPSLLQALAVHRETHNIISRVDVVAHIVRRVAQGSQEGAMESIVQFGREVHAFVREANLRRPFLLVMMMQMQDIVAAPDDSAKVQLPVYLVILASASRPSGDALWHRQRAPITEELQALPEDQLGSLLCSVLGYLLKVGGISQAQQCLPSLLRALPQREFSATWEAFTVFVMDVLKTLQGRHDDLDLSGVFSSLADLVTILAELDARVPEHANDARDQLMNLLVDVYFAISDAHNCESTQRFKAAIANTLTVARSLIGREIDREVIGQPLFRLPHGNSPTTLQRMLQHIFLLVREGSRADCVSTLKAAGQHLSTIDKALHHTSMTGVPHPTTNHLADAGVIVCDMLDNATDAEVLPHAVSVIGFITSIATKLTSARRESRRFMPLASVAVAVLTRRTVAWPPSVILSCLGLLVNLGRDLFNTTGRQMSEQTDREALVFMRHMLRSPNMHFRDVPITEGLRALEDERMMRDSPQTSPRDEMLRTIRPGPPPLRLATPHDDRRAALGAPPNGDERRHHPFVAASPRRTPYCFADSDEGLWMVAQALCMPLNPWLEADGLLAQRLVSRIFHSCWTQRGRRRVTEIVLAGLDLDAVAFAPLLSVFAVLLSQRNSIALRTALVQKTSLGDKIVERVVNGIDPSSSSFAHVVTFFGAFVTPQMENLSCEHYQRGFCWNGHQCRGSHGEGLQSQRMDQQDMAYVVDVNSLLRDPSNGGGGSQEVLVNGHHPTALPPGASLLTPSTVRSLLPLIFNALVIQSVDADESSRKAKGYLLKLATSLLSTQPEEVRERVPCTTILRTAGSLAEGDLSLIGRLLAVALEDISVTRAFVLESMRAAQRAVSTLTMPLSANDCREHNIPLPSNDSECQAVEWLSFIRELETVRERFPYVFLMVLDSSVHFIRNGPRGGCFVVVNQNVARHADPFEGSGSGSWQGRKIHEVLMSPFLSATALAAIAPYLCELPNGADVVLRSKSLLQRVASMEPLGAVLQCFSNMALSRPEAFVDVGVRSLKQATGEGTIADVARVCSVLTSAMGHPSRPRVLEALQRTLPPVLSAIVESLESLAPLPEHISAILGLVTIVGGGAAAPSSHEIVDEFYGMSPAMNMDMRPHSEDESDRDENDAIRVALHLDEMRPMGNDMIPLNIRHSRYEHLLHHALDMREMRGRAGPARQSAEQFASAVATQALRSSRIATIGPPPSPRAPPTPTTPQMARLPGDPPVMNLPFIDNPIAIEEDNDDDDDEEAERMAERMLEEGYHVQHYSPPFARPMDFREPPHPVQPMALAQQHHMIPEPAFPPPLPQPPSPQEHLLFPQPPSPPEPPLLAQPPPPPPAVAAEPQPAPGWVGEIDPTVLADLPVDLRSDVIRQNLPLLIVSDAHDVRGQPTHIDPLFLAALPINVQDDVIAMERAMAQPPPADDGNTLMMLLSSAIPPDMRRDILMQCDLAQLDGDVLAEAQQLRAQMHHGAVAAAAAAAAQRNASPSQRHGSIARPGLQRMDDDVIAYTPRQGRMLRRLGQAHPPKEIPSTPMLSVRAILALPRLLWICKPDDVVAAMAAVARAPQAAPLVMRGLLNIVNGSSGGRAPLHVIRCALTTFDSLASMSHSCLMSMIFCVESGFDVSDDSLRAARDSPLVHLLRLGSITAAEVHTVLGDILKKVNDAIDGLLRPDTPRSAPPVRTQNESVFTHPRHAHPLPWSSLSEGYNTGRYSCNVCSFSGSGMAYHCSVCSFDLCPFCAATCRSLEEDRQRMTSAWWTMAEHTDILSSCIAALRNAECTDEEAHELLRYMKLLLRSLTCKDAPTTDRWEDFEQSIAEASRNLVSGISAVVRHIRARRESFGSDTLERSQVCELLSLAELGDVSLTRHIMLLLALPDGGSLGGQREVGRMWHACQRYLAEVNALVAALPTRSAVPLPAAVQPLIACYTQHHVQQTASRTASLRRTPERSDTEQLLGDDLSVVSKVSERADVDSRRGGAAAVVERLPSGVIRFLETNRHTINALIHWDPSLLQGNFSPVMRAPRLIDFEFKARDFRRQIAGGLAHRGSQVSVRVGRERCFADSLAQLRLPPERLRGSIHVKFKDEEGADAGGLTREWFQLLAEAMVDPAMGLLAPSAEGTTWEPRAGEGRAEHDEALRFCGRVLGLAVFHEVPMDVHFTRSVYRHLVGLEPCLHDLRAIDDDLYRSMAKLLEIDVEAEDLALDFTISLDRGGTTVDEELVPGGAGIPVTNANKKEYIRKRCEWRMTKQIERELGALLLGFYEIIPREYILAFSEQELELIISGLPDVDVEDLRSHTDYQGYSPSSPQIRWFWECVAAMEKEDRANLLQFSTGASKVPPGGFGGTDNRHRFTIIRVEGSVDKLPVAHTCFNRIDLPEYPTAEILREKLMIAITLGNKGFTLM